jgi:hypothetical protein
VNTKPLALRDVEPQPDDPCARVSVVTRIAGTQQSVWGFTNGELWLVPSNDQPLTAVRVNRVKDAAQSASRLPSAVVTEIFSPADGQILVGFAGSSEATILAWTTTNGGQTWLPVGEAFKGNLLGAFECPFHAIPSHFLLSASGEGHVVNSEILTFSSRTTDDGLLHLSLPVTGTVQSIANVPTEGGYLSYVGTTGGVIVRSPVLTKAVVWDSQAQRTTKDVLWSVLPTSELPRQYVTHLAASTLDPHRVFAVLNRTLLPDDDGTKTLWFSHDAGNHWSNRHGDLPTTSPVDPMHPIIRASFHPILNDVAYVVTPTSSFYTTDMGVTWHEG